VTVGDSVEKSSKISPISLLFQRDGSAAPNSFGAPKIPSIPTPTPVCENLVALQQPSPNNANLPAAFGFQMHGD
jgi:hypothetical protein